MKPHCAAAVPTVPTVSGGDRAHRCYRASAPLDSPQRHTSAILALLSETDIVPIAQALPDRTLGVDSAVHRTGDVGGARVGSFPDEPRQWWCGIGRRVSQAVVVAARGAQSHHGEPASARARGPAGRSYAAREPRQNIGEVLDGVDANDPRGNPGRGSPARRAVNHAIRLADGDGASFTAMC